MIAGATLLVTLAAAGQSAAASALLEEQAFAAVKEKRYCEALDFFVAADRVAPSPDLALNAAQVAEAGGDRYAALRLLKRVRPRVNGTRLEDADARWQALIAQI